MCFVVTQEWNMGQKASNTSAVFFEDVVVPEEVMDRLGIYMVHV